MDKVNEPKTGLINQVGHDPNIENSELPISANFNYEIDNTKKILIDLTDLKNQGYSIIQTVFIDNSLNAGIAILTVQQTNQVIKCPAGKQGYFPILSTTNPKFNLTTDNTAMVKINLFFLNFILSEGTW